MKNTLIFIAFVLIVLGLLYAVSGKRVPPPLIPDDNLHIALNDASGCMDCHGPDKKASLRKAHPPKFECLKCHKAKKGVQGQ